MQNTCESGRGLLRPEDNPIVVACNAPECEGRTSDATGFCGSCRMILVRFLAAEMTLASVAAEREPAWYLDSVDGLRNLEQASAFRIAVMEACRHNELAALASATLPAVAPARFSDRFDPVTETGFCFPRIHEYSANPLDTVRGEELADLCAHGVEFHREHSHRPWQRFVAVCMLILGGAGVAAIWMKGGM